jgi:hypothetical protein
MPLTLCLCTTTVLLLIVFMLFLSLSIHYIHSSLTVGIWRSLRITLFVMYLGASTILRKPFDWKRSTIYTLEVET